jgi:uncharacterized protein (TIGR02588 family)
VVKKKSKLPVRPHPIEWIVGIGSSLLVAAVIAIIGYEALTSSGSPPRFTVSRLPPAQGASDGQVRFAISNTADTTAAAVLVHGEWRRGDGTVETAEVTLDYVPARSTAAGALIFSTDPGSADLSIRAIGYADP